MLPTKVLHGNIKGKRKRDRQPKTWIDSIKEDVKIMNMDIRDTGEMTTDREVETHC